MRTGTRRFVIAGLAVALLISILAPYLASPNPDGLESAAEKFEEAEGRDYLAFNSPLPDYTVPSLGETGVSGIVAIVIGTMVTFLVGFGLSKTIKSRP
ncbi:MAG: cobalamin biosynthesis protein CbiN [Euryarchaeota archaeon]|nr:cobalamin biosynthesis protein CbiN [Euryarchaeota archaeon]